VLAAATGYPGGFALAAAVLLLAPLALWRSRHWGAVARRNRAG